MSYGKNKGKNGLDLSPMQEDSDDIENNSVIVISDSNENVNNNSSLISKHINCMKSTLSNQSSDSSINTINNGSTDSSKLMNTPGSLDLSSDISCVNYDTSLMESKFTDSSPISTLPENSILNKVSDGALVAFICRPNSYIVCGSCGNIWQRNTSKSSSGTYLRFSYRGTLSDGSKCNSSASIANLKAFLMDLHIKHSIEYVTNNSFFIKRHDLSLWESFNNSYSKEKDQFSYTRLSHISNVINAKNTTINSIRKQFSFMNSFSNSACLALYWMRNSCKTNEIKEYNSVITDGLFWVSNSRKFNTTCAIFGIPPSLLRLFCLACKLRKHIRQMNPSNPLSSSFSITNIRNNQFLTNSFGYRIINYNIFQHDLFPLEPPRLHNPNSSVLVSELDSLNTRLDKLIISHLSKSIMASCIISLARVSNPSTLEFYNHTHATDRCVFIRDSITRNYALLWRTNSFGNTSIICPICKNKFNRAHVNHCNIFGWNPPFLYNKHWKCFKEDLLLFHPLPPSYNILDSLLNHHEYSSFCQAIDYLESFNSSKNPTISNNHRNSRKHSRTPSSAILPRRKKTKSSS